MNDRPDPFHQNGTGASGPAPVPAPALPATVRHLRLMLCATFGFGVLFALIAPAVSGITGITDGIAMRPFGMLLRDASPVVILLSSACFWAVYGTASLLLALTMHRRSRAWWAAAFSLVICVLVYILAVGVWSPLPYLQHGVACWAAFTANRLARKATRQHYWHTHATPA